ncbi:Peptidyl-prolyl cis-trans isomerase [Burkholderiales bacterium]|jgi:peptidyl-prolyl cis-trans isomerase D|nr:Peptidyl-prolyl cis-trans isomerase [Burkholderiales bacterium]
MFDTIRNHRNWVMPLLIVVVFLPLVFTGIYGFTRFVGDENTVAKIDGESISQQELEVAQRERIERMVQMLGPSIDTRMFDTPQARASTLDSMLSEKAIEHEAARLRLSVSDARMQEIIGSVPQFQLNGKFDYDTYLRLLTVRGFTEASFEARVRSDVGRQTLDAGVAAGALLPRTVIAHLEALEGERRQIRRLQFRPEAFLAKATVSEEAIKSDYESNKDLYRTPEHAKVQYLVLRLDDLAARTPVNEAEVRDYYEKNKSRWAGVEQRRASHILITSGKDGSAPDKAAARALAENLLRQVRAKPADFARLAREYSKDPGSAEKGGDLGWFGRSMMTKPFEDAAFALKEGQISDIVESDFGFHIILVTGVKGTQTKPFEEVRASIESEMRKQAAQKSYAELAEQFTNFVYEQSDSLAAAAEKFKLPLQTIDNLTRQGVPQQPDKAAIFTPTVLDAVFSADALEKHRNTKAIDIGNNALVSVRVLDYTPATVRPLEEVRAAIKAKLERAAAVQLARQTGEARLAQLRQAADDSGFEAVRDLGRGDGQFLPMTAINAIMTVPADHLPTYLGVDESDGAYAIVHVLSASSVAATDDAGRAKRERTWLDQVASAEQLEYVQALRERFDARVTRADLSAAGRGGGKSR